MTARYPAILAIELSASIFCARDIRGMQSIARTVACLVVIFLSRDSFFAGQKKEMRVESTFILSISLSIGSRTFTIRSQFDQTSFASLAIFAPTSSYLAFA